MDSEYLNEPGESPQYGSVSLLGQILMWLTIGIPIILFFTSDTNKHNLFFSFIIMFASWHSIFIAQRWDLKRSILFLNSFIIFGVFFSKFYLLDARYGSFLPPLMFGVGSFFMFVAIESVVLSIHAIMYDTAFGPFLHALALSVTKSFSNKGLVIDWGNDERRKMGSEEALIAMRKQQVSESKPTKSERPKGGDHGTI
jgi:hypothetical protein